MKGEDEGVELKKESLKLISGATFGGSPKKGRKGHCQKDTTKKEIEVVPI